VPSADLTQLQGSNTQIPQNRRYLFPFRVRCDTLRRFRGIGVEKLELSGKLLIRVVMIREKTAHLLSFNTRKTLLKTSSKLYHKPKLERSKDGLSISAIDAAQPFDFEAKAKVVTDRKNALKIGIVGFGNFGQFVAKRIISKGHTVIATSRGDYSAVAADLGACFYPDIDDFCEEHPDIVILSTSILSTEKVLREFPFQRLRRNTLFCDVLSVKQFPKQLFLKLLPQNFDILCLHPMFGPDSGKGSWRDLPLVYEKVRVGEEKSRKNRCEQFLHLFEDEGCRMVEMSCEEHDRQAASSQFITHTVGRMLGTMELADTSISTKGFESLRSLVDNTYNDSFDLYYGLFMYNKNATIELSRLEQAFDEVKGQLFNRLHEIIRNEIFTEVDATQDMENSSLSNLQGASEDDKKKK